MTTIADGQFLLSFYSRYGSGAPCLGVATHSLGGHVGELTSFTTNSSASNGHSLGDLGMSRDRKDSAAQLK